MTPLPLPTNGHARLIGRHIPNFEPWDIVKVPFPDTARPVRQNRPALVIAADELQAAHGLLWLAMITSAANRGWSGDGAVSDLGIAGLPAPPIVRPAKIATIHPPDPHRLAALPPPHPSPPPPLPPR